MKKIPPVYFLRKPLAIAFLVSCSVLSSRAQNISTGFNATAVSASNIPNDNTSLNVYPNPAADEAKLVFNSSKYDVPYEVRIINNAGIQISNMEGTTVQGQNTLRIDVGNYPPGVYYVQLLTSAGRETLRLLKQPLNGL
jgi:hypothetical protein